MGRCAGRDPNQKRRFDGSSPPASHPPHVHTLHLFSHIPLGVLADLASLPPPHPHPWSLTVHFRAFPSDALIRWPGPDPGRSAFVNSLKEAACAAAGSAAGILSAPVPDRDAVWAAADRGDADAAWTATSAMLAEGGGGAGGGSDRAACVPVRLFVCFGCGGGGGGGKVTYTSRPVPGAGRTLGEAVLDALPRDAAGWALAGGGSSLTLGGAPVAGVLSCGVPAPLGAPAAWAHAALAAPDRFLYVVVRVGTP